MGIEYLPGVAIIPSSSSISASSGSTLSQEVPVEAVSEEVPEYSPSGLMVHIDSVQLNASSSAASTEVGDGTALKPVFVEMYYLSQLKSGKPNGIKYKTHPLSGTNLKFDYSLTIFPTVSDALGCAGDTVVFMVKERCTFGEDVVLGVMSEPVDLNTFTSAASSPKQRGSETDLVSISIGKKTLNLTADSGITLKGWLELVSQKM